MSRFFTEVTLADPGWRIGYQDKLMLMGSCFTENVGEKLRSLKFQVDVNPFGIIYNPFSVAKSLRILLSSQTYTEQDLFEHNGVWSSFDYHGRFSDVSTVQVLRNINDQLVFSRSFFRDADYLIITFGTSWVYELKTTGAIVSNCHKIPAANFKRYRLTPGGIVDEYREVLPELWNFNSKLKVLFTVSPVRHWKDGASGNQLSKSVLLLAVDKLITGFGEERCAYFPAYEIMMDELRDYRFYAPDMLHPSQVAVDYIWDKFAGLMIAGQDSDIVKNVLKIIKAKEHRPFNSNTMGHKKFLLNILNEIQELMVKFPYLNLQEEKSYFESQFIDNQN